MLRAITVVLMSAVLASAQSEPLLPLHQILLADNIVNHDDPLDSESSFSAGRLPLAMNFVAPVVIEKPKFNWNGAVRQSFYFLSLEQGFRMFQSKTRQEFAGPFFRDYVNSIKGIRGWNDGDTFFTNYVAHPLQGSVSGYIQVQNDPAGIDREFGKSHEYWNSRLKAFAWSAAYSTQFEIGLYSEATLGNVGLKPGMGGYSDLVMTPLGGFGLILAEDALDRFVVNRLESRTANKRTKCIYRIVFNPSRSIANVFRLKIPCHRDTRDFD